MSEKLEKVLLERELARRNLKDFLLYKFKYYHNKPFLDNWHYEYIAKHLEGIRKNEITRLIVEMPPSYGKTELVCRTFVPFVLGNNPKTKIIYTSYSDELTKNTSIQTRDFIKSTVYKQLFDLELNLTKSSDWNIKNNGGGMFATTVGGPITGRHGHIIIVDDPLKASAAYSNAARKKVADYYEGSILSRLEETNEEKAAIVLIMQRLHKEDLVGKLISENANLWTRLQLPALNDKPISYVFDGFKYERKKDEALFEARHNKEKLESLQEEMGRDAFLTQYQQDPHISLAGVFEPDGFCLVEKHKPGNIYIIVDPAESVKPTADNRALVVLNMQEENRLKKITLLDCLFGKWDIYTTCKYIMELGFKYKGATIYIEQAGGGISLKQVLEQEVLLHNTQQVDNPFTNPILGYTPPRKIPKTEKIMMLLPMYNLARLTFLSTARGLAQVQKELFAFSPERQDNDDNCIDAIASPLVIDAIGYKKTNETKKPQRTLSWRV